MNISTAPAHQVINPPPAPGEGPPVDLRGVVVVAVDGDVDLRTGPDLTQALTELMPPRTRELGASGTPGAARSFEAAPGVEGGPGWVRAVVVDLTEVEFIDSSAVGVLVQGHHRARRSGCAYALVATHPMIHTLFEITGLARVLPLHPDVGTAVAGLRLTHGPANAAATATATATAASSPTAAPGGPLS